MIGGDFILLVFLIVLNLILIAKTVPIIGVPVGIFTVFISVVYFINLTVAYIPANPYTTALLTIFAIVNIFVNGADATK